MVIIITVIGITIMAGMITVITMITMIIDLRENQ
jgi:hypothetical protein